MTTDLVPSPAFAQRPLKRIALIVGAWIIALLIAFALDARVARTMRDHDIALFLRVHDALRETIKLPGIYYFSLGVAVVVAIFHWANWRAALFLLACSAVAGLNQPIKWLVGRTRPFKLDELGKRLAPFELHPFRGGKNLCFPSGHAALAFATAATLAILWPRWKWIWFALATIVAVERFAENAHWLSDCVAAAALGIGGAHLVSLLARRAGMFDASDRQSRTPG